MAPAPKTDLLSRLADLSEEAVQRLGDMPGADRVLGAMNTMRERIDELQRRVRGLEDLEKRLAALERKVDKLSKDGSASSSPARKTTTTKSSGGSRAKQS